MGDGFVVLQSSDIDIYYYQDEPGVYYHLSALQQFGWFWYFDIVDWVSRTASGL